MEARTGFRGPENEYRRGMVVNEEGDHGPSPSAHGYPEQRWPLRSELAPRAWLRLSLCPTKLTPHTPVSGTRSRGPR